jgi:hypothetical protein
LNPIWKTRLADFAEINNATVAQLFDYERIDKRRILFAVWLDAANKVGLACANLLDQFA